MQVLDLRDEYNWGRWGGDGSLNFEFEGCQLMLFTWGDDELVDPMKEEKKKLHIV